MAEEKGQPETALAIREPLDIFSHFDALDDAAIVDEMEGRLVESAIYHFNQGGKELWGLAKTGVDWCATELAKKGYIIRDEELSFVQDPTDGTFILFTAKVGKYFVDKGGMEAKVDSTIGTKRQWTKMERRDGSLSPDPFWFEKGSQKAIRNARMRLIPEETKAAIITAAKSGGKVREVKEAELAGGRGVKPSGAEREDSPALGGGPTPAPVSKHVPKWDGSITLTLSNGDRVNCSYFDAAKKFQAVKKAVGDGPYYELIGGCGFEHYDDIPKAHVAEVFTALVALAKMPK